MSKQIDAKAGGIIILKAMLTLVAFVVAIILSKNLGNTSNLPVMLGVCMILPIWYNAPNLWRIVASVSAIVAGLGIWMIAPVVLSIGISDISTTSAMFGAMRVGATFVSIILCYSILRTGRSKRDRDQGERSIDG